MRAARAILSELRKTATLPGSIAGIAIAVLGPLAITLLNATGIRDDLASGHVENLGYTSPVEAAFSAVPIGTVGAVVIGVIAMSSEYTANSTDAGGGRQITATLTATPGRVAVLAAKAVAVVVLVGLAAAAAIPASLALSHAVIGEPIGDGDVAGMLARTGGAALYWALMALIALGVTVLTRSGIVPLIVLIANSSVVSVSILLANVTSLAYYLPDVAGMRMFTSDEAWGMFDDALAPVPGGLVMGAWSLGLLVVASVVLSRRDA